MSDTATERRMTPTERLHEVTMASLARRPAETEHTIEISRNAKGVAQFSISVRGSDLDAVMDSAIEKFDFLAARYPYDATQAPVTPAKAGDAE